MFNHVVRMYGSALAAVKLLLLAVTISRKAGVMVMVVVVPLLLVEVGDIDFVVL
jgi:hypothetical protein